MLRISADKIARVAMRVRALRAGTRRDSDADIRSYIEDMTDGEKADLTAVMWIGRGSFDAEDLAEARETAHAEASTPTADYLLGSPHLADHLEAGMEALGLDPGAEEDELMRG